MRTPLYYIILFFLVFTTESTTAQDVPKRSEKAQAIYDSWVYHNLRNNYDSSMYYGDDYVKYMLKYGSDSSQVDAYNHKIRSLRQFKKLNEGFKLALTTYDKYCGNSTELATCKSCDPIYQHLADFMITLRDYRQGINYLDMGCHPKGDALNFYMKAKIYLMLEKPDSAQLQTLESIAIARQQNNPRKLINTYNQHGLISKQLGEFDEAIKAFSTAIQLVDSLDLNESKYGYLVGNMGACYFDQGDFDGAYTYLAIDAAKSKKRDVGSFLNAEIMLAEIDIKRKDYNLALLRLDTLMHNYERDLFPNQKLPILEMYMLAYQSVGNNKKYQFYLSEWVALTKSEALSNIETNQILVEEYAANALRQVTLQVETEKELLNQKLIVKEKEARASKLQKWMLTGVALMIILIILFILSRYRKKALLKETQLKLANKEQELLKLKVEEENRNVQVLSHELLVKQDFSSSLIKQLEQLGNLSKPELRSIEFFIQNELDIKSTRAHLQNQMGDLSSNFYGELKINHPELTELELKLAAMVVMQMSNKEIAISKNTTLESSKKAKNRLKKKLEISPTDDLVVYLNKFL